MSRSKAIKVLVKAGFDQAFAEKATDWFGASAVRDMVKFVAYVKDNEYLIRNS